jgi:hypothetical protein
MTDSKALSSTNVALQNPSAKPQENNEVSAVFVLGPLALAIIGGVIAGGIVVVGQKLYEHYIKSGELFRAMTPDAQFRLQETAYEINALVDRARQEDGNRLTLHSNSTREKISQKIKEAAEIIRKDLPNIADNNLQMESIGKQTVDVLKNRANEVAKPNSFLPTFDVNRYHSDNLTPSRNIELANSDQGMNKSTINQKNIQSNIKNGFNENSSSPGIIARPYKGVNADSYKDVVNHMNPNDKKEIQRLEKDLQSNKGANYRSAAAQNVIDIAIIIDKYGDVPKSANLETRLRAEKAAHISFNLAHMSNDILEGGKIPSLEELQNQDIAQDKLFGNSNDKTSNSTAIEIKQKEQAVLG